MIPTDFPQANTDYHSPAYSQIGALPAYVGEVKGGSLDSAKIVVVAWKPTPDELCALMVGGFVYVAVLGELPPHLLSTDFDVAIKPL